MAKLKHQMPERMWEIMPWVSALDSWENGYSQPLSRLITEKEIPEELRQPISEIVSGERKPNLKAKAKLKVTPPDRLYIGSVLFSVRHQAQANKALSIPKGDELGLEPIELIRKAEAHAKDIVSILAEDFNVSESTVESAYEALLAKIKAWPVL